MDTIDLLAYLKQIIMIWLACEVIHIAVSAVWSAWVTSQQVDSQRYVVYTMSDVFTKVMGSATYIPYSGHHFKFMANRSAEFLRKTGRECIVQHNILLGA